MPRPLHATVVWAGLAACLAAAAACGGASDKAKPGPTAGLEVREVRAVLSPDSGAVYLTVIDHGGQGDRLLAVETTAAKSAGLHESVLERGVMRMAARPEGFAVPPGGTLKLAAGGKHVMLDEPRPGGAATLPLTLRFERSGTVTVEAAVVSPADAAGATSP